MSHIEIFWKSFLQETAQAENVTFTEAFSFGYGEQMADSLAQLVLQEKKMATCYRYVEKDEISQPGELSIVLDGRRNPVCTIKGFSFNENLMLCFEKFKVIYTGKEK